MIYLALGCMAMVVVAQRGGKVLSPMDQNICKISENFFQSLQSKSSYPDSYYCDLGIQYVQNPELLRALPKPHQGNLPVYLAEEVVIKDFGDGNMETVSSRKEHEDAAIRIIENNDFYRLIVPSSCVSGDYSINQRLPIQDSIESKLLYETHPEKFTEAVEQFTRFIMQAPLTDIIAYSQYPRFDNIVPYLVKEGDQWIGQLGLVDLEHLHVDQTVNLDDIKNVIIMFPYHYNNILQIVEELIPERISESKGDALGFAVVCGRKDIVERLLLERDITLDAKGEALDTAAWIGRKDILERLLLERNITPDAKRKALDTAAWMGRKDIVERLLSEGDITPNAKGKAFHIADRRGHKDIVKMLLSEGDIPPDAKEEVFVLAALNGRKDILERLLLQRDITPDAKGKALDTAARRGHKDIVERLLLERDITPDAKRKALDTAVKEGHEDIVEIFLLHGAIPAAAGEKIGTY